jgi:hypothetical protein
VHLEYPEYVKIFFLFNFMLLVFVDIDECRRPGACGINAICQNYPGNYTCACQAGYTGNPFDGVCSIHFESNQNISLYY